MPHPGTSPFWEPDKHLRRAESAAEGTVSYCLTQLELSEAPLPIPVELWVERPLGLRLSVLELVGDSVGIEGGAFIDRSEIVINQLLCDDEPWFRFVCAHELGHMVLHGNARRVFHSASHASGIYSDIYDKQADRFAEAILMPGEELLVELGILAVARHLRIEDLIRDLILGTDYARQQLEDFVPALAERFLVRVSSVASRLSSLQFADGPRLLPGSLRRSLTAKFGRNDRNS